MTPLRPLLVMGTRPEAIKMAPVVAACRAPRDEIEPIICFTGQHDEMLRQVTDYFDIQPDFDLKLMTPGQSLAQLTARCLIGARRNDRRRRSPTASSPRATRRASWPRRWPRFIAAFRLCTSKPACGPAICDAPWPEEFNRRVASITTALHCAPTPRAAENLRAKVFPPQQIRVTGNTVIDALLATDRPRAPAATRIGRKSTPGSKASDMVLITVHRRENHGAGLDGICTRHRRARRPSSRTRRSSFPVHLNPHVQKRRPPAPGRHRQRPPARRRWPIPSSSG